MIRSTALVTGASRGIGAAIARGLAADGLRLIGLHFGRDRAAAEQVAAEVRAAGAVPVLLQHDLSGGADAAKELAAAWQAAVAEAGHHGTDVLVSNAGINAAAPLSALESAEYDRVIAINLTAPLFLIRELAPHFNENARVIGISTAFTRITSPAHVAYTASKAGLEGALRTIAPELGTRGITVNTIAPGPIDTEINSDWINAPGAREAVAAEAALGRIGQPEDVADVVRFLASDAGRFVTGQRLEASGGARL